MRELNLYDRIATLEQSVKDIKAILKTLKENKVKKIDNIEVPYEIYEDVKEIIKFINFDRIITAMNALKWTIHSCNGPITKEFLKKSVIQVCVECYKQFAKNNYAAYNMGSGGWYVRCSKYEDGEINLNVSFRIESADSYELRKDLY